MSTRAGGVSQPPFDSLNLRPWQWPGTDVDAPDAVRENQRRLAAALGATPVFLRQVHGTAVRRLTAADLAVAPAADAAAWPAADAAITTEADIACTAQVADCLPVLLASRCGRVVGAAHAGWRGLAAGVLERTVEAMGAAAGVAPADLQAWLGPSIGPLAFEVGADVLQAFGADPQQLRGEARLRFVPRPRPDGSPRWLADLPGLARDRLAALGLRAVYGGRWCTVSEPSRFFSFRRSPITGRMAACIARRA
ncbi:peptidoglycan editing factor PgeF [Aquabacterium sp. OR-4]|uniref:peptidoglycan editing factor PgeF n=1 Tax=Aquabacterium sp. OR-4 TaxID=2978127 RepID=UPI0021B36762|nr:peptidoglycan editing factor PgeF [Aquabacterium sp. OR-4]MDT7835145.1 peptidoglycan editing factor PgeF [Aquabacterium sp. OR-4]